MSQGKRTDLSDRRDGFTPATWKMLDADISAEAAMLLLRMHRIADRELTDGIVSERDLEAIAAFHHMKQRSPKRYLAELMAAGFVELEGEFYKLVQFFDVSRSRDERLLQNSRKRLNQKNHRDKARLSSNPPDVTAMSPGDFTDVTTANTTQQQHNIAAARARAREDGAAAAGANAAADDLPAVWAELTGRPASSLDVAEFESWRKQFGYRVSTGAMAAKVRELFVRQQARGDPPRSAKYFRGAITELLESPNGQPTQRPAVVRARGEGEPPEAEELPG